MKRIQLCSGLLRRDNEVLLVRCRYAGEAQPLWVLPGGRQQDDETIVRAIVREFAEETGLQVRTTRLAYASESIDRARALHVVNCTFFVAEDEPHAAIKPADPAVVEARFVPIADAPQLLKADVLRVPVAAALSGRPHPYYFAFDDSSVEVPFFTGPPGTVNV